MEALWQRTGDPLGDFIRLVLLVEELLERLGAPKEDTLGAKLRSGAAEAFFQSHPEGPALRGRLWRLVELRNAVLHERAEVPSWAFSEGRDLAARLLAAVERQGFYSREEWTARMAFLEAPAPPTPQAFPEVIPPERARSPEAEERPPGAWKTLPFPRRPLAKRALAPPRRRIP
ncbi:MULTISPECIES: hypothetical protein [Thermus]|jgi:hypothetical protein|uniref:Uncharacterized protein n=2 Tax=Thermus thermophilus TaxID=274 RepID=Q53W13_THET8|nr:MULTISPECIES: hypothetical protein [Thermus]AAS82441.1 hypothetical protein TT_P0111 [Thermus thermophilus HB27]QZY59637.1 hypothetical protein K7H19_10095 [Thermus thermophilus]WMV96605.1 hypothetical protein RB649_10915 [Thermus thermophilus HB27]BAD71952.1 hypothetical protein [Thermus thermophilus HB8]BBL94634.1 hypothetical protein TthHC11_21680 [Thermus thermophilus]